MYKVLYKYSGGMWNFAPSLKKEDAVNSLGDSIIYKMSYTFGLAKTQTGIKKPHYIGKPGDFLVVGSDGSFATMSKYTYSKYFPNQPQVVPSKKKTNKDL